MAIYILVLSALLAVPGCWTQQLLPARLPHANSGRSDGNSCPTADALEQAKNATRNGIHTILSDIVVDLRDRCTCGSPGQWTRVAYLNMSQADQQCPTGWNLVTAPIRGCGRTTTCNSAIFVVGRTYSRVCGKVNAIQRGTPDAFSSSVCGANPGIDGAYFDGVSLTHGASGSQQHIWSFVAALYEADPIFRPCNICPCTNVNVNWPYQVPSFVGSSYFCATGNPGPHYDVNMFYTNNPLWDGEGCGLTNACCQFNHPPWFCKTLSQPTNDALELRICCDDPEPTSEDTVVTFVDIYVM